MTDRDIVVRGAAEGRSPPVGILSIGDLAMERDEHSIPAGISASPADR
ncbi:MAG: hypothetical protein ACRDWN_04790 [Acidimicrobiales bacterium]